MPSVVRAELDGLLARGTPGAAAARTFARALRPVPSRGRGDAGVVEAAVRLRATVVTGDRALAERLRRAGVAVLVPREHSRLELKLPRPGARPAPSRRPRRPKG